MINDMILVKHSYAVYKISMNEFSGDIRVGIMIVFGNKSLHIYRVCKVFVRILAFLGYKSLPIP